jgi:hypothetical protein
MTDVLTDRASLVRAFFRLVASSSDNPAMTEHDSDTLEAVYQFLQYGAWDAQAWLLDCGLADRWVSVSSALTWSGSDSADGGRYAALPADFLRAIGDDNRSCLRVPGSDVWGSQVDFRDRWTGGSNRYWFQDEYLWISKGSAPLSGLCLDYHEQLATLEDSTTVDFPSAHRALIVAYAADRAATDAWLPGDLEMQAKILSNLTKLKKESYRRVRRTSGPRKLKMGQQINSTHWMV